MNRRLLFVLPNLLQGGAQKVNIQVANRLAASYGYRVSMFVQDDSSFYRSLISPQVELIQRHVVLNNSSRWRAYYNLLYLPGVELERAVNWRDYDYIIAGWEAAEFAIEGLHLRHWAQVRSSKTKFMTAVHSLPSGWLDRASVPSRLIMRLSAFLRPRVFHRIIAVSSAVASEVACKDPDQVVVIPPSIDLEAVQQLAGSGVSEEHCRILQAAPYFVNVAGIMRLKNQEMLVVAFDQVQRDLPHNLILLGNCYDDKLLANIRAEIILRGLENRVLYLGAVSNPYPYVQHAEALLMSSNYEGCPLTILEAMALKRPVISTQFPGHADILNNQNAYLVPRENPTALADALRQVSVPSLKRDARIEAAYATVSNFQVGSVAECYHRLIVSLQCSMYKTLP